MNISTYKINYTYLCNYSINYIHIESIISPIIPSVIASIIYNSMACVTKNQLQLCVDIMCNKNTNAIILLKPYIT